MLHTKRKLFVSVGTSSLSSSSPDGGTVNAKQQWYAWFGNFRPFAAIFQHRWNTIMTPKYKTLGELFTATAALTKPADKVELLRANGSHGLVFFLRLAFSDVKWAVPSGLPPFKADRAPYGHSPSHLLRELRLLYLFLDNPNEPSTLPQVRREQLFQQLLERLHPDEVSVLSAAKEGTFPEQFKITKSIVNKAFPGLLDSPVQYRITR